MEIVFAILLRDMRTRFGRSHLGYLVAVAWPLSHLFFVMIAFTVGSRIVPLGTDPAVFIGTGILPYVLCLYPARQITFAVDHNKGLFYFPVVSVYHVFVARALLEILTCCAVTITFMLVMASLQIDILPQDLGTAAAAIAATIYLAGSLGALNMILYSLLKFWQVFFILIMLLFYLSGGVLFLPNTVSQEMQQILWFNPLLHCIEWLRSAYYDGYGDDMLSREYLIGFSTVCLFLGLAGERFIRGKLLMP